MRDVILDVEEEENGFIGTDNGNGNGNAKTYTYKFEKDQLGKNYTFKLKDSSLPSKPIYWSQKYEVTAVPVAPTTATGDGDTNIGSGAVAGIIIAVILIVLCAILLVVMWQKGLLCAKTGPAKGAAAGGGGGGAHSTAASTADALDYAEQGYASAEDVNIPPNGGLVNPAGPTPNNAMNGYGNPPPEPYGTEPPEGYYSPVIRATPDHLVESGVGGGGGGGVDAPGYEGMTDGENNLPEPVKESDRMSDDSGVERNGHLPPETGV